MILIEQMGNLKNIEYGLKNKPCFIINQAPKTYVYISSDNQADIQYLKDNSIEYLEVESNKSTKIIASNDIEVIMFASKEYCKKISFKLMKLLSGKITGGIYIGTDFIYGGKKYAEVVDKKIGDCTYFWAHILNNIEPVLIDKLLDKTTTENFAALENKVTIADIENLYQEVIDETDN